MASVLITTISGGNAARISLEKTGDTTVDMLVALFDASDKLISQTEYNLTNVAVKGNVVTCYYQEADFANIQATITIVSNPPAFTVDGLDTSFPILGYGALEDLMAFISLFPSPAASHKET